MRLAKHQHTHDRVQRMDTRKCLFLFEPSLFCCEKFHNKNCNEICANTRLQNKGLRINMSEYTNRSVIFHILIASPLFMVSSLNMHRNKGNYWKFIYFPTKFLEFYEYFVPRIILMTNSFRNSYEINLATNRLLLHVNGHNLYSVKPSCIIVCMWTRINMKRTKKISQK